MDLCIISFNLNCIMQLKQFSNIAIKGSSRKKCYYFWWSTWLLIDRCFVVDNVLSHSTGGNFRENAQDINRWIYLDSNVVKISSTLSRAIELIAWLPKAVSTLLASYGQWHRHDPGSEKNRRQCTVIRGTSYITTQGRFRVLCSSNVSLNRLWRLDKS